jgi:hypothetical protein
MNSLSALLILCGSNNLTVVFKLKTFEVSVAVTHFIALNKGNCVFFFCFSLENSF